MMVLKCVEDYGSLHTIRNNWEEEKRKKVLIVWHMAARKGGREREGWGERREGEGERKGEEGKREKSKSREEKREVFFLIKQQPRDTDCQTSWF